MRKPQLKHGVLGVLVLVLLLGLLLAAGPAAAATCVDCHAAPPDGPSAPHAVLVAAVTDCTTCHKGMSPHPGPASVTTPAAGAAFNRFTSVLAGFFLGNVGANVYLQQRLWGTTDWTDLTQVTTAADGAIGAQGGMFTYTVPSPTAWAAYRAICEGAAGTPVILPAKTVWKPTPDLTIKLSGVVNGVRVALMPVTATVRVRPLKVAGEKVTLAVYRYSAKARHWIKLKKGGPGVISSEGTCAWTLWGIAQPVTSGKYEIRAAMAGTADHRATMPSLNFKVK
jgi:hypothetical protein